MNTKVLHVYNSSSLGDDDNCINKITDGPLIDGILLLQPL